VKGRIAGEARTEEAAWPRLVARCTVIPPFPGPSVVEPVVVPPPPRLDPGSPLHERATVLARAYGSVIRKRHPGEGYAFLGTKDARRSRHYVALAQGADALTEKGYPPMAWLLFSFDVWKNGGVPPLEWAVGATRVTERGWWFRKERSLYEGGRVWTSPLARVLVHRWWKMRADLLGVAYRDAPVARIERAVHRHFPEGWQRLVDNAREDAQRARAQLAAWVAEGRCIW
jgi:hypothetical protein